MSTQDIEIKVPQLGESISEALVGEWYVKEGAYVSLDARVVGLETDKATFDIPAQAGGVVSRILKNAGETATIGEVIGFLRRAEAPTARSSATVKRTNIAGWKSLPGQGSPGL